MCGPSSATKAINSSIQDFAGTVKSQAGDIFSGASTVFHNIMDSVKGIVSGGPSQFGYSQGEYSAKTAAAVNAGAAEARNLRGAAASSSAAIGGGNVAAPAGATQTATMAAEQKAAADTATAENEIVQGGFETGRQNYENAINTEEKATEVFNPATSANASVTGAQHEAMTSQTQMDQASNWAMNDVMKLGTAAVSSFASGGFGSLTKMFKGGKGGGSTDPGTQE